MRAPQRGGEAVLSAGIQALLRVAGHAQRKAAMVFTGRDGSPALTIAGLWDVWSDHATGERLTSCTMIITEPNGFVGSVHDPMPVLLAEKDFEAWLGGGAGLELLKPAPDGMLQR